MPCSGEPVGLVTIPEIVTLPLSCSYPGVIDVIASHGRCRVPACLARTAGPVAAAGPAAAPALAGEPGAAVAAGAGAASSPAITATRPMAANRTHNRVTAGRRWGGRAAG